MTKKHRSQFTPQQSPAKTPVIQEPKPIVREVKEPGKKTIKENVKEYWPTILGAIFIIGIVIYALAPLALAFFNQEAICAFTGEVVFYSEEGVVFTNVVTDGDESSNMLEPCRTGDNYTIDVGKYNVYFQAPFHYSVWLKYTNGRFKVYSIGE